MVKEGMACMVDRTFELLMPGIASGTGGGLTSKSSASLMSLGVSSLSSSNSISELLSSSNSISGGTCGGGACGGAGRNWLPPFFKFFFFTRKQRISPQRTFNNEGW